MPATGPGALAVLGAGVVDYAGLFPPAALDMATAVANHAAYRAADDAWMLGRFVVPVARLDEWRAAMHALPDDAARTGWRLSALLGADPAADCDVVRAFNADAPWGAQVDVLETKGATPATIAALARMVPSGVTCYVELPHRDDPRDLVRALRTARLRAKIRTGGVVADAFPTPHEIVRFLRRCHDAGVACKATAGLHHPLRGTYRLTYAPDAPQAPMYGWVNVVVATAAIADGHDDATAERLLTVDDPRALVIDDAHVSLAGVTITRDTLAHVRTNGMVAFGSCSFREPVDELQTIIAR